MLKEKLRAQLVHVAAAYSRCVLCIGGSPAFELSVMSAVDELIALGRRCDVALCVLTACSPAALEVRNTRRLPDQYRKNLRVPASARVTRLACNTQDVDSLPFSERHKYIYCTEAHLCK